MMADDTDRATQREEEQRSDALARVARKRLTGESATHCQGWHCGEPIPQARREALPGVQLCIDCAQIEENKKKRAA